LLKGKGKKNEREKEQWTNEHRTVIMSVILDGRGATRLCLKIPGEEGKGREEKPREEKHEEENK